MEATNSSPAVDIKDDAPNQQADRPPQRKPEKELLCTICNLRACWEAPAAPADTPDGAP